MSDTLGARHGSLTVTYMKYTFHSDWFHRACFRGTLNACSGLEDDVRQLLTWSVTGRRLSTMNASVLRSLQQCMSTSKSWLVFTPESINPLSLESFLQRGQYVCLSACPSIRLSVTIWYCVKTRERRGSSPLGSPMSLVFWCQECLMRDDPVRIKKIWAQSGRPPVKQPSCTHFAS